jgi:hypothetical protein
MKPRKLQLPLFATLTLTAVMVLRLVLGTKPGMIALAVALLIRLLWFLYQSMHVLTIALWDASASIAESIQDGRERRVAQKEARHAARLL